jgi:hypothetical protein
MDDLVARLSNLFRRYQFDFPRTAGLSEAETEQATEPFRREIGALIAEHGREAVEGQHYRFFVGVGHVSTESERAGN